MKLAITLNSLFETKYYKGIVIKFILTPNILINRSPNICTKT